MVLTYDRMLLAYTAMLSALLLGSVARRAILARTYLDPAQEYHLRELVRRTGLAPRTVHQEVEKLVRGDLLTERRDGNRRYLRANDRHPLFRAVREIVLKTEGLADVLRQALGDEAIEYALVFGSIAAAAPKAGSDVDLLVVGSIGLREAVRRLRPAQDTLGREIVPLVWTRAEFERRRRAGDAFLSRILAGPIIPVAGSIPTEHA
jgi:DNA-binding transcriptional ArsR family regulator